MKRKTLAVTAAAAVVALGVAAVAVPTFAHGPGGGYFQGGQGGYGMMGGPQGGMMGGGHMGPGMMGPGGYGGGHGRGMGPGGYGGQGWGGGMFGRGAGDCPGQAAFGGELSVDTVTAMIERRLGHWGNDRIKVGQVVEQEDGSIVAEIVTQDGSLVEKLAFDPKTGRPQRVK